MCAGGLEVGQWGLIPWFSRARRPVLAGIWTEWTDPARGDLVLSYTMLTQNCDSHPLLALMHKPDPSLPPDQQDKRSVIPIARADWERWLGGSIEEAMALVKLPEADLFQHGPADPRVQAPLLPGPSLAGAD